MATPQLIERIAQPFVAIRSDIQASELSKAIDRELSRLFGWLAKHGVQPAGAPFVKYDVVDMQGVLQLEFGVPTSTLVRASDGVHADTLPSGRFAVSIYVGHYDGLRDATAALLQSAKQLGVEWDSTPTPQGERFAARLETYLTDPSKERDPARWQTEIAVKTK